MSLFNKNKSSSDSSQKTSTTTSSKNTNVQGGNGINIGEISLSPGYQEQSGKGFSGGRGGGGGINIVSTDSGAIQGSLDLASTTVDAARSITGDSAALAKSISQGVFDFASSTGSMVSNTTLQSQQKAYDFASGIASQSGSLVDKALSAVVDTGASSLSAVQAANANALDSNQSVLDKALSYIGDVNTRFQDSLSSTVSTLNDVTRQNNTSSDQRIQDTATTAIKYVVIAIGVIAVAVAIYAGSRK